MNGLTSHWLFRAGVVAGATWLAWKYLPVGPVGKTAVIAIGAVAGSGIIAGNIPLLGGVLNGQLPLPSALASS